MPDLRAPDELIALEHALARAKRPVEQARKAIYRTLRQGSVALAQGEAARVTARLVEELQPALEQALLASALAGARRVGERLPGSTTAPGQPAPAVSSPATPPSVEAHLRAIEALPEELAPDYLAALLPEEAQAVREALGEGAGVTLPPAIAEAELPLVAAAAEELLSRRLIGHQQLKAMTEEAKRQALAVGTALKEEAADRLQQLLIEQITAGPDQRAFRERVLAEELLPASAVETAFRDGVQAAYHGGLERLLAEPLVGEAFPYIERMPIRDRRLSSICEIASRSGIDGGAIFRRDDPVWQKVKPPSHNNCRCSVNPLTVEQAAHAGVAEARAWLRTGQPPTSPAWVLLPAALEEALRRAA